MSIVREFLHQKDGDYQQYVPESYKFVRQEKTKIMLANNLRTKFEISTAARCMKPCFKNFATTVVSETESECMTNCIAKSIETLTTMQLHHFREADKA